MSKTNQEISYFKIVKCFIDISRELSKGIEIQVECRVTAKMPEKDEVKKLLLNVEMKINTKDSEDLNITMESDIVYNMVKDLEDYEYLIKNEYVPEIQNIMFGKLDDILINMGQKKLNLAQK